MSPGPGLVLAPGLAPDPESKITPGNLAQRAASSPRVTRREENLRGALAHVHVPQTNPNPGPGQSPIPSPAPRPLSKLVPAPALPPAQSPALNLAPPLGPAPVPAPSSPQHPLLFLTSSCRVQTTMTSFLCTLAFISFELELSRLDVCRTRRCFINCSLASFFLVENVA